MMRCMDALRRTEGKVLVFGTWGNCGTALLRSICWILHDVS